MANRKKDPKEPTPSLGLETASPPAPLEVFHGFLGLRAALRRQQAVCDACVLRDAGRTDGNFWNPGSGRTPRTGAEAFREALRGLSVAGLGDFTIETLDWKAPSIRIRATRTFEAQARMLQPIPAVQPACDYSAGFLEGLLIRLLSDTADSSARIECVETQCRSEGASSCQFTLARESLMRQQFGPLPRHEHPAGGPRETLERERIQSEKIQAIAKLAGHVAHEVRNPLSSIRLNLELLRDECHRGADADFEEAETLLEAIQQEVSTLTRFTDEYLQFARMPKLHWESLDLGELLNELPELLEVDAQRARVQIRLRIEPRLPEIEADLSKLRKVLLHLAQNALDAMKPRGGHLDFELSQRKDWLVLHIRDDGPGIEPRILPRIFEPFFTTKEGGTGLGLALCQQIVREHGGLLECTSQPGQGADFTLELPIHRELDPAKGFSES